MVIKSIDVWKNIFVKFHRTEFGKKTKKLEKTQCFWLKNIVIIKKVDNHSITTRNYLLAIYQTLDDSLVPGAGKLKIRQSFKKKLEENCKFHQNSNKKCKNER